MSDWFIAWPDWKYKVEREEWAMPEHVCETVASFIEDAEEHGLRSVTVPVPLLKAILPSLNATGRLSAEDARLLFQDIYDLIVLNDNLQSMMCGDVREKLQAYADALEKE